MRCIGTFLLLLGFFTYPRALVGDPIKIVATLPDLADLAHVVGGDEVEITTLARGSEDPHLVDARPSMVVKLRKAALLLLIGMDLDMWVRALTDIAGNRDIVYGGKGYIDCSIGLEPLQVPTAKIDGASGDIHLYGNPHYNLDPKSAVFITKNILDALVRVAPNKKGMFEKNRNDYLKMLDMKITQWESELGAIKEKKMITYHDSWPYFAKRFGIEIVDTIEPKPGIPPSPAHLSGLLKVIAERNVKVILRSDYHSSSATDFLEKHAKIKVVIMPQGVGGVSGADTFIHFFDYVVSHLAKAFGGGASK